MTTNNEFTIDLQSLILEIEGKNKIIQELKTLVEFQSDVIKKGHQTQDQMQTIVKSYHDASMV